MQDDANIILKQRYIYRGNKKKRFQRHFGRFSYFFQHVMAANIIEHLGFSYFSKGVKKNIFFIFQRKKTSKIGQDAVIPFFLFNLYISCLLLYDQFSKYEVLHLGVDVHSVQYTAHRIMRVMFAKQLEKKEYEMPVTLTCRSDLRKTASSKINLPKNKKLNIYTQGQTQRAGKHTTGR